MNSVKPMEHVDGERALAQAQSLIRQGNYELAESLLRQVHEAGGGDARGCALMGTACRMRSDLSGAHRWFEAALAQDPQDPVASVGRALLIWHRGNAPAALSLLQGLLETSPDNLDAVMAVGDVFFGSGAYVSAIRQYERVLRHRPLLLNAWHAVARCVSNRPDAVCALEDPAWVEKAFDVPGLDPHQLGPAAVVMLLGHRPALQPLWEMADGDACLRALRSGELSSVTEDSLLRKALLGAILGDVRVERGLTVLRHALLFFLTDADGEVPEGWRELAAALAVNCGLGEFVWLVSQDENARLSTCPHAQTPDERERWMLAYAMYGRLAELSGAEASMPGERPVLERLRRDQVQEPAEERALASSIVNLTPIADRVSAAVGRQYEENPYPRWRDQATLRPRLSVRHILRSLFHHWTPPPSMEKPSVLVAGCGTCCDALSVAHNWDVSTVTGVDLSRASLAYGLRMARKLGVDNVALYQADLLALDQWDARFDLVLCTGVLHHMADPLAGARVVTNLLRPGGVIKLALYSAHARRDIMAAQQWAAAQGLPKDADGMRELRRRLLALPDDHPAKDAIKTGDFFFMSGCRDLLLHVQEHNMTMAKIDDMLDQLGLDFLGFQLKGEVSIRYDTLFPDDPHRTDLTCWSGFESLYPETFRTMYQFWCQKR